MLPNSKMRICTNVRFAKHALLISTNNLGKHISTKLPVSSEKFQCTVEGYNETFKTRNARTRHLAKNIKFRSQNRFSAHITIANVDRLLRTDAFKRI